MEKVMICLSGTGNSFYVANRLCRELHYDQVLLAPHLLDDSAALGNPKEIGVVFPTYKSMPPRNLGALMANVLADDRFSNLEFFFAITTCGVFPGYSLKIAEKLAMNAGILCSYASWVRMPDTFIPLLAVPPADKIKAIIEKADARIRDIAAELLDGKFKIPARKPFTAIAFRRYLSRCSAPGVPMVHSTDSCTGCGHCEAVCPNDAITMRSGRPEFSSNCENCLGCYHFCPVHAIELNRKPLKGYTYYSSEFTGYRPDYRK